MAEPTIELIEQKDGKLVATLKGWSEYDPGTGAVEFRGAEKVKMWMLDTKYDGIHFCARRIHLTRSVRRRENKRFLENVIGKSNLDDGKVHATWGYQSTPFPKPEGELAQVAVKVITEGDGELFGRVPI